MTWEDGYAIERGFLSHDEVDLLRRTYQEIHDTETEPSSQILYTHQMPSSPRPHLTEIATQWFNLFRRSFSVSLAPLYTSVGKKLEAIGLNGYSIFQDSLIQKVNTSTPFHWHQDYPFWPVNSPDGWTLWIALDPVDQGNGRIEIARGSNRMGIEPVIDLHTGEPQRHHEQGQFRAEDFEIISPDLQPGDALFFHALTYHFSEPNTTSRSRRAWASVWMGPEVRWQKDRAPRHFICKQVEDGEPVTGFWKKYFT